MPVDLEWYRTFYNVARLGSITLAAEGSFVSQPAVSQTIKALEAALGCNLFVRTPKGVKLTPEGEVLYRHISGGFEQIASGEKAVREMLDLERGEIHIGASDMTLRFFLLPYLEKYHRLYPKIKIRVTNGPSPETLTLLKNGKIDFAAVSTPVPDDPDHSRTDVALIKDVFIAGTKYAHLKGKKLSLAELGGLPLICLEKETSSRRHMDDFLAAHGVEVQPEFELATSDLIVQFTARDLGVGCVMRGFAEQAIADGSVFEPEFEAEMPERHISIIKSRNSLISKAGQKLLDLIAP